MVIPYHKAHISSHMSLFLLSYARFLWFFFRVSVLTLLVYIGGAWPIKTGLRKWSIRCWPWISYISYIWELVIITWYAAQLWGVCTIYYDPPHIHISLGFCLYDLSYDDTPDFDLVISLICSWLYMPCFGQTLMSCTTVYIYIKFFFILCRVGGQGWEVCFIIYNRHHRHTHGQPKLCTETVVDCVG